MKTKMQGIWKRAITALAALILISTLGISQSAVTAQAAGMSLSKTKVTMTEGKTTTLTVSGATSVVGWSSSKDSVVEIQSISGSKNNVVKIKAVKAGTAKITAKIGSTKLTCKVTVKGISINTTEASLDVGKTVTLKVTNATKKVVWKSSDTTVAKVSSKSGKYNKNAKIKAMGEGTAKVTAKIGSKKITVKITVAHVHSWTEATCTTPKTCTTCGATEGSALGHVALSEATCTNASICARCYTTITAAYGHSYTAATCTTAQTCTRCGATNGSALGHIYNESDRDCTHDATCSRCGEVVLAATGHNFNNAVATCLNSGCSEYNLGYYVTAMITTTYSDGVAMQIYTRSDSPATLQLGTDLTQYVTGTLNPGDGSSIPVSLVNSSGTYLKAFTLSRGSTYTRYWLATSEFTTDPNNINVVFGVYFNNSQYQLTVNGLSSSLEYGTGWTKVS